MAYITRLKAEQKKYEDNGYKKCRVHNFVLDKVIKDCIHRFLIGVKQARSLSVEEQSLIHKLGNIWAKIVQDNSARSESHKRAAHLIRSGLPRSAIDNKEDFIEAWSKEGACRKILSELEGPTMRLEEFYEKFYPGYSGYRTDDANDANRWVMALEGCKYFLTDDVFNELWLYVQMA